MTKQDAFGAAATHPRAIPATLDAPRRLGPEDRIDAYLERQGMAQARRDSFLAYLRSVDGVADYAASVDRADDEASR